MRGTTSETLNPGPSFTFIAFVVTFTFFAAPTTLLLLCGVGDWGSLKGYTRQHTVATYILSSAFSGVVELTTQLLRLISILWLPLCRINKLGYSYPRRLLRSPTLVGYLPPSFLFVFTLAVLRSGAFIGILRVVL